MGCAQSVKGNKYAVGNKSNKNSSSKKSNPVSITQEFMKKAKDQGIQVQKLSQAEPISTDLLTTNNNNNKPKALSNPNLLHNIEILHKHNFPKLKPLSCNNLFKNRQNLGLSVRDQRSTIASLQPHNCAAYFSDYQTSQQLIPENSQPTSIKRTFVELLPVRN